MNAGAAWLFVMTMLIASIQMGALNCDMPEEDFQEMDSLVMVYISPSVY